jgi:hypothetical protein
LKYSWWSCLLNYAFHILFLLTHQKISSMMVLWRHNNFKLLIKFLFIFLKQILFIINGINIFQIFTYQLWHLELFMIISNILDLKSFTIEINIGYHKYLQHDLDDRMLIRQLLDKTFYWYKNNIFKISWKKHICYNLWHYLLLFFVFLSRNIEFSKMMNLF